MLQGAPGQRVAAAESRPRNCEQGFPDLCHREVPDRLQVDVRKVGHLVGRDDAIDYRRPVDFECFIDLAVQIAWLRCPESMAAAGARQRGEIRIGEFDALPIREQTPLGTRVVVWPSRVGSVAGRREVVDGLDRLADFRQEGNAALAGSASAAPRLGAPDGYTPAAK